MMYCSTRGRAAPVSFEDALLAGLAPDGGLYMPESWRQLDTALIHSFAGQSFAKVAAQILTPFVGEAFTPAELKDLTQRAFSSFTHPATCPLVQVGDEDWILELFHGPTLAFKDVAMQLLGVIFEAVLARRSRGITIIGATSGDTGGAAIEALKNRAGVNVFILHPEGRISEVQRRIMTTSGASNIYNIAVDGTFDDCQAIVKTLFGERDFALGVRIARFHLLCLREILAIFLPGLLRHKWVCPFINYVQLQTVMILCTVFLPREIINHRASLRRLLHPWIFKLPVILNG